LKVKYLYSKDLRAKAINDLISDRFPGFLIEKKPDLVLVAGGDGAILHAIQKWNHLQVPFLGYAAGTLNFLMNKIDDLPGYLNKLLNDQILIHTLETTSIKVELITGEKSKKIGQAINEVVLGTGIMGYHHFELSAADYSFDKFEIKGSAISVATDLGSTGYNFNSGGPVIPIGCQLWSINGVVCNRFLNDIIHIQKLEIRNLIERSSPDIFLDGINKKIKLHQNSVLVLTPGEKIKIAFDNKENFLKKRTEIASRYRK
jgi:NAD kinase